jgi:hypothetical protein
VVDHHSTRRMERKTWYDTDDVITWAKTPTLTKYNSTSEYSTRKKKTPKIEAPPELVDPATDGGGNDE